MTEVWKPIPGYNGYEVSNLGRVHSHKFGDWRILKPRLKKRGYYNVCLRRDGTSKNFDIHFLVLRAFVGPRPEGMLVCHLDHNPGNNCLSNLEFNTPSANNEQTVQARGGAYGLNGNHARVLTVEQVKIIRSSPLSCPKLATQFGVHPETVRLARNRKTYKWV